jgi:hypothetical protein
MDDVKRNELEHTLRETLKEHQRDGLNMIGNVDQLVHRLTEAVDQWLKGGRADRKTA